MPRYGVGAAGASRSAASMCHEIRCVTKHVSRGASRAARVSCHKRFAQHVSRRKHVPRRSMEASMMYVRSACLALGFVAIAVPASAQNWVYEPDTPGQVYQPRPAYQPREAYAPPAYAAPAYEPDRQVEYSTTYRTVVPQARGRAPIVRERIVTETVPAGQMTRQGVLAAPVGVDYSDYMADRAAADAAA